MTAFYIIFAIVFLIYVIIYEGMNLRQRDERQKGNTKAAMKWEKARHGWGFLLRAGAIALMVPLFWGNWLEMMKWILVMCCISWPLFNLGLNLFRGLSIFYKGSTQTGTGSLIDRILNNTVLYWSLQGILLIGTIVILIIF